ncbi:MAG: hypothetical protein LBR79_01395 [Oscillospiraceae bacterium]|jgi:hypothetical protein|nr:hypothetical protein [Oscillospiraceae bacterium]
MGKNKAKVLISCLLLVSLLTFKVSAHKDTPEYEKVYNSLTANSYPSDKAEIIADACSDAINSGVSPEIAYKCVKEYLSLRKLGSTKVATEQLDTYVNRIKEGCDLVTAEALSDVEWCTDDEKVKVFVSAYADGVKKGFIKAAYHYAYMISEGWDPKWADLYARMLERGDMIDEQASAYVRLVLKHGWDPAKAEQHVKTERRFGMRVPGPTPRS